MKETVRDRLIRFIEIKKISVRAFEKACSLSNGYIRQLRSSPTVDKIESIICAFPELNRFWLLTGEGDMLNNNEFLEPANWIICDTASSSPQFANNKLLRIGLRLSEVARLKPIDPQGLADRTGIDYHELMDILTANKPATDIVIIKVAAAFPDINPYWLSTGQSTPFIKDLLPEMEIDNLPEKLAAAEKQLHEKDFVISLQKDTIEGQKAAIEGLKGQVALLEEKTTTLQYTERAPSKNDASSKGKTARGNVRATTLG
ncbi:MAG: hypothetical protein K2H70_04400 [Bacteroidales bacterium]|nr:hypothetical protein [Bacteroidales bacterium]